MTAVDPYRYDLALDEIRHLRAGAAMEAHAIGAVMDAYATLPANVLRELASVRDRLREAARGLWDEAWHQSCDDDRRAALRAAGAPETLTRATWENERV